MKIMDSFNDINKIDQGLTSFRFLGVSSPEKKYSNHCMSNQSIISIHP
jgi:hypothetical protein